MFAERRESGSQASATVGGFGHGYRRGRIVCSSNEHPFVGNHFRSAVACATLVVGAVLRLRRADLEVVDQSAAEVPPAVRARHKGALQENSQVLADLKGRIPSYMGGEDALRRIIESERVIRLFEDARFAPLMAPGGSRAYLVSVSVPVSIHQKQGVDDGTSFLALIAESGEVLQRMEGRFGYATVRQDPGEQTTLIADMALRWQKGQIVPPEPCRRDWGCT